MWHGHPQKGNIIPGAELAPPAPGKSGVEPDPTAGSLFGSHETTSCGSHRLSLPAHDRPTHARVCQHDCRVAELQTACLLLCCQADANSQCHRGEPRNSHSVGSWDVLCHAGAGSHTRDVLSGVQTAPRQRGSIKEVKQLCKISWL